MTTFYILLVVYLLSIVSMYSLMRYIYIHKLPYTKAEVWVWIVPVVNTMVAVVAFILCWKQFPICGLPFWEKRWDKPTSSLDKIRESLAYHPV